MEAININWMDSFIWLLIGMMVIATSVRLLGEATGKLPGQSYQQDQFRRAS